MNKMILELMNICDIDTNENGVGWKQRRDAMKLWINKYIHTVDTSLSVINPNVINMSTMDIIKESLAAKLAEDLTTYTNYTTKGNKITAKLTVVKELGVKNDGA